MPLRLCHHRSLSSLPSSHIKIPILKCCTYFPYSTETTGRWKKRGDREGPQGGSLYDPSQEPAIFCQDFFFYSRLIVDLARDRRCSWHIFFKVSIFFCVLQCVFAIPTIIGMNPSNALVNHGVSLLRFDVFSKIGSRGRGKKKKERKKNQKKDKGKVKSRTLTLKSVVHFLMSLLFPFTWFFTSLLMLLVVYDLMTRRETI